MTEQNIASLLKQLRKTSAYSANEVVEKLKEYDIDISSKTLYGYESGLSMLNADVFVALCKIYKCDNPMDIFGGISIKPEETALIEQYRSLDPYGRETVSYILNREYQRVQSFSDRDTKIAEQAARIAELEDTLQQYPSVIRMYTYLNRIASAGKGFYFDDIPTDQIEAPYLEGADFVIGVNGDSMEPEYYDGDKVYVKKCLSLEIGDVGIFTLDGECYIKEWGGDRLISYNDDYDDISIYEDSDIKCIGIVIGKLDEED